MKREEQKPRIKLIKTFENGDIKYIKYESIMGRCASLKKIARSLRKLSNLFDFENYVCFCAKLNNFVKFHFERILI